MFRKTENDQVNNYFRMRVKQARLDAGETQADLARILEKTRVAVSDLERGRVAVSAADLSIIAAHYGLPVSFFYPPRLKARKKDLSSIDEELLFLFWDLPETQQRITLEYVRQQVEISQKAKVRQATDNNIDFQSKKSSK